MCVCTVYTSIWSFCSARPLSASSLVSFKCLCLMPYFHCLLPFQFTHFSFICTLTHAPNAVVVFVVGFVKRRTSSIVQEMMSLAHFWPAVEIGKWKTCRLKVWRVSLSFSFSITLSVPLSASYYPWPFKLNTLFVVRAWLFVFASAKCFFMKMCIFFILAKFKIKPIRYCT